MHNYIQSEKGKIVTKINSSTPLNVLGYDEIDYQVDVGYLLSGDSGKFEPPPVDQQKQYENAVQKHLNQTAQSRGYDDIVSACSYSGAPNPFQTESQAFTEWRGNVWAYCYQLLSEVEAGTRTAPTLEELIAELPAFTG